MTAHDYSEFKHSPTPTPEAAGGNSMARLAGLAQEQLDAEALIASLEAQLKEAKASFKTISENRLPSLMNELEIPEITVAGKIISVSDQVFGSISEGNAEEAMTWLEDDGNGGMVKRTFVIDFSRDEEKWANKFQRDCAQRKKPLNLKRTKTVNAQTLRAFVRSSLAEGKVLPMETLGVYVRKVSKVKVKT